MFKDELAGLPPYIQEAVRSRIEQTVRIIVRRAFVSVHEPSVQQFTKEELHAMLSEPFKVAELLRPDLDLKDSED